MMEAWVAFSAVPSESRNDFFNNSDPFAVPAMLEDLLQPLQFRLRFETVEKSAAFDRVHISDGE
jgi:hypothetical protein